jgi:hypothetical protein
MTDTTISRQSTISQWPLQNCSGQAHSSRGGKVEVTPRRILRSILIKMFPFSTFSCRFDDSNMQRLITMMNDRDRELIPCDTKFINWEKYLMEIHIPSVMDYESREATRARL